VKTAPVDPSLPIRGRYVQMRLETDGMPGAEYGPVTLEASDGRLVARPDPEGTGRVVRDGERLVVAAPVAFFIPDHVPDPSRREPGEELWVEVTVPRRGPPRPIRLAIGRDGRRTPIEF
jgi:hypothetical protein